MKIKILLLGIAVLLILAAAGGAVWWMMRPQVITFGDDAKVTFLAVDFGKKHVPPTVKAAAVSGSNRPAARSRASSFTTSNDTLVVWVRQQYDPQEWHNFNYYLYDKKSLNCVASTTTHSGNNGRRGNDVVGVEFSAFPRRGGTFYLAVMENSNGSQELAEKKFAIHNPAHGPFTQLTAEHLPATRTDDDLTVTLTKFVTGAPSGMNRNDTDPADPMNQGAQATLHIERDGKVVDNWQPVSVVTTDATGNEFRTVSRTANSWNNGWGNNTWENGDDIFTYQFGLWPDEPAWKVRMELSQQSDFADSELWTISNVELKPGRRNDFWNYSRALRTNAPVAETTINDVHLKLLMPRQFTDANQNSNPQGGLFVVADPPLPEGMRLTLVKMTDDQTNDIQHWENVMNYNQNNQPMTVVQYQLQDVYGLTNINLTFALHKSRFVEFTAKPEPAAAPADNGQ